MLIVLPLTWPEPMPLMGTEPRHVAVNVPPIASADCDVTVQTKLVHPFGSGKPGGPAPADCHVPTYWLLLPAGPAADGEVGSPLRRWNSHPAPSRDTDSTLIRTRQKGSARICRPQ